MDCETIQTRRQCFFCNYIDSMHCTCHNIILTIYNTLVVTLTLNFDQRWYNTVAVTLWFQYTKYTSDLSIQLIEKNMACSCYCIYFAIKNLNKTHILSSLAVSFICKVIRNIETRH